MTSSRVPTRATGDKEHRREALTLPSADVQRRPPSPDAGPACSLRARRQTKGSVHLPTRPPPRPPSCCHRPSFHLPRELGTLWGPLCQRPSPRAQASFLLEYVSLPPG